MGRARRTLQTWAVVSEISPLSHRDRGGRRGRTTLDRPPETPGQPYGGLCCHLRDRAGGVGGDGLATEWRSPGCGFSPSPVPVCAPSVGVATSRQKRGPAAHTPVLARRQGAGRAGYGEPHAPLTPRPAP